MKRKILSFILSVCLILPFALNLGACNGGPPPSDPAGKLTETEWKERITTQDLFVKHGNYVIGLAGGETMCYTLELYNDDYYIRDEGQEYQDKEYYYYKNVNNGQSSYQKIAYRHDGATHSFYWDVNDTSEAIYNSNISEIFTIVDYIKNNQSKFALGPHSFENSYSFEGYKLNIAGSEIEQNIANLKAQMRLSGYNTDWVLVQPSFIEDIPVTISFMDGINQVFYITCGYGALLDYTYENLFNSTGSYTLSGGPSQTDVDYCEIKIAEDGYHVYYPNRGTTHYDKEFFAKDNGDGTYSTYRPDNAGGWTVSDMSQSTYYTTLETTIKIYFGNLFELSYSQFFKWENGKIVNSLDLNGNRKTFNMTQGRYTYTYSNFEISVDQNCELSQMTWNMQIHDSALNASSLVYNMTLVAGNTTIEYPNV